MKVKDLIKKLQQFDGDYDVEIEYYNVAGLYYNTWPSIDRDLDIYVEEDESNEKKKKVVIDLGDFNS